MPQLYFNGIQGGSGRYLLPPLSLSRFAEIVRHDLTVVPAERAALAFLDAADLSEVGWGVVFPPAVDPAVREALGPLLELRRSQAGDLFRGDLAYYGGSWLQFLEDHGAAPGPVDPRSLPYYLLLIGGPREIPFEIQYLLDVQYAVGRLSFETAEEYARYVEGLLACERGEVGRSRRADIFGVRNQDDPNTALCERYLVNPLAARLAGDADWKMRCWRRERTCKAELTRLLGGPETPSLLLTASHAMAFWGDDPAQPSDQGALLCYDWPGPQAWRERIPPEQYFAACDLASDADVRGLISFHFACFSAGTPKLDAFSRASGAGVPRNAPEDFMAALPRRLLGHPRGGALAVVGHVDQAWVHSFVWRHTGSQIGHFESVFKELMAGRPVGLALEAFGQRYAAIAAAITQLLEDRREKPSDDGLAEDESQVFLWMAHNDARSYVLLGDPAARLALTDDYSVDRSDDGASTR